MDEKEMQVAEIVWLNPEELKFFSYNGVLRLTVGEDRSYWKVQLYRCFALTDPERYISVRDAQNNEIGIIRELQDFNPETQRLLREELHRRYIVAIITRILRVGFRHGLLEWEVETDRGQRKFLTRTPQDSIEQPEPHRCLITDVDSNRYHIPDITSLDPISFAMLRRFL